MSFRFPALLALVCALLGALAPAAHGADECIPAGQFDPDVDLFPAGTRTTAADDNWMSEEATVTFANQFQVQYKNYYKVVNNIEAKEQYILWQCGSQVPPSGELTTALTQANTTFGIQTQKVFQIPLKRVAAESTVSLTFLEILGVWDRLWHIPSWAASPCLQAAVSSDSCTAGGNAVALGSSFSSPDLRAAQVGNVSAIFTDVADASNAKAVVFSGSQDPGSLNRMEWIKFVATFFNQERSAVSHFNRVRGEYEVHVSQAASAAAAGSKKTVAWVGYTGPFFGDTYYLSYAAFKMDHITDAGGAAVSKDAVLAAATNATDDAGLQQVLFKASDYGGAREAAHALLAAIKDVDVVVDEAYSGYGVAAATFGVSDTVNYDFGVAYRLNATTDGALVSSLRFLQAGGAVYRLDATVSEGNGLDWFESALPHPNRVMRDFLWALQPGALEGAATYKPHYLRKIAPGAAGSPTIMRSSDCPTGGLPVCSGVQPSVLCATWDFRTCPDGTRVWREGEECLYYGQCSVECVSVFRPTTNYFPDGSQASGSGSEIVSSAQTVQFADQFAISYHSYYKVVTQIESGEQYVLWQCGTKEPSQTELQTHLSDAQATYNKTLVQKVFRIPLSKVSTESTVSLSFLDVLGLDDRIFHFASWTTSACFQDALQRHEQGSCGSRALPLALSSDAEVKARQVDATDAFMADYPGTDAKHVAFTGSKDPGTLNRMEWIKFIAAFFNKERDANVHFDKVASEYAEHKRDAEAAAAAAGSKKTVAWVGYTGPFFGDTYYLSYAAFKMDHITDAGGAAVSKDAVLAAATNATDDAGLQQVLFKASDYGGAREAAHALLAAIKDVDVVVDEAYSGYGVAAATFGVSDTVNYDFGVAYRLNATTDGALVSSLRFLQAGGAVYRLDATVSEGNGLDWFESALPHPNRVMRDFLWALQPGALEGAATYKPHYLRKIAPGAAGSPAIITASSCPNPGGLAVCTNDPSAVCPAWMFRQCPDGTIKFLIAPACTEYEACPTTAPLPTQAGLPAAVPTAAPVTTAPVSAFRVSFELTVAVEEQQLEQARSAIVATASDKAGVPESAVSVEMTPVRRALLATRSYRTVVSINAASQGEATRVSRTMEAQTSSGLLSTDVITEMERRGVFGATVTVVRSPTIGDGAGIPNTAATARACVLLSLCAIIAAVVV
ncbi:unnamed protein product [Pedinophyceae sp. YPF-701]|nr:unnamed protein product [Pedinophyceae sp. YPF-701]